jgi:hypothetical protein
VESTGSSIELAVGRVLTKYREGSNPTNTWLL